MLKSTVSRIILARKKRLQGNFCIKNTGSFFFMKEPAQPASV